MWQEELTLLAEFLGIPLIILTPLVIILYVLFKFIIPKMLGKNSKLVGRIVISIITQLFGDGGDDELVEGVEELPVATLIKSLPSKVEDAVQQLDANFMELTELLVITNEVIMSERFIKPGNDEKLRQLNAKGKALIDRLTTQKEKKQLQNTEEVNSNEPAKEE